MVTVACVSCGTASVRWHTGIGSFLLTKRHGGIFAQCLNGCDRNGEKDE